MADARARRTYLVVLLALAVGGGLLLWSTAQTWAVVRVPLGGLDDAVDRVLPVTGRDLVPLAMMACVVGWAGIVGIVATRGWLRRVIGLLVAIAGVVAVVGGLRVALAPFSAAAAFAGSESGAAIPATSVTAAGAWWWVTVGGAVLVVLAGAAAVLRGQQWPALGSRYERQPATADPWAQLDAGVDPSDPDDRAAADS